MTITPNPGFAILLGALFALVLPRAGRPSAMIAAAIGAAYLIFAPGFGAGPALAQIGLTLSPLRMDSLSQVFGLGFALITITFALFSSARRDKLEDIALMAHAGGATTAVFAGDLVSFVAAAQFCALAGAVLVFAGRTAHARAAGVRLVCWQVLSGALMTAGVAMVWAASGDVRFERMQSGNLEGALLFAGFLIMAGAPLAHVWVKDALPRTRALGGAALGAFTLKLGIYALARAFPGEPALLGLGAALGVGALVFAALTSDVRQSAAYGLISQSGAAMAAIGIGTPLALAAASAMSFAGIFHGSLALLALGLACERAGAQNSAGLGGLVRTMPLTAGLAIVAALSAMAAPGLVGFAASAILSDAVAHEDRPLLWLALTAASAGAVLHIGGRLPYTVFFGADRGLRPADAAFAQQLAMGLAAFFCVAIGVAPGWLYGLLPENVFVHPYDWDHLIRHAELAVFAVLAFAAITSARLDPGVRSGDVVDIDWLWRGPGKRVLVAAGRGLDRLYDLGRRAFDRLYGVIVVYATRLAREGDRPAAPDSAGLIWALLVLTATMLLLFAFQR